MAQNYVSIIYFLYRCAVTNAEVAAINAVNLKPERSVRPVIRTLFTSGYTDDMAIRHGLVAGDANFIQKPFASMNSQEQQEVS